ERLGTVERLGAGWAAAATGSAAAAESTRNCTAGSAATPGCAGTGLSTPALAARAMSASLREPETTVRWWIESYVDARRSTDRVNEHIYKALEKTGIEMPNPMMTIELKEKQ
ncbi:MAG: hypothetical protein HGA86_07420, partial [Anaerolineaceae bacterium]|nr:hypothetical protein [Anaerolineaceae bacterium]